MTRGEDSSHPFAKNAKGWGTHCSKLWRKKQIPRFARDDKSDEEQIPASLVITRLTRGVEEVENGMNLELEAMALEMPEVAKHPNRLPFRGVLTLVGVASRRPPSGARGHRGMLTRKATEAALPSLLGMALDYAPALDSHDARRKIGVITEAEIVAKSKAAQGLKPFGRDAGDGTAQAVPLHNHDAPKGAPHQDQALRGMSPVEEMPRPSNAGGTVARKSDPAGEIAISGYLYAHDFPDVVGELRAGHGSLGMSYEITDAFVVSPGSPVWTVTAFTFTGAAVLRREKAAYPETWIAIGNSPPVTGNW